MKEALFAIDASVYIFRSYFALEPRWQSRDGRPTETVYGFAAFLLKLLKQEQPGYIAAAFDESLGSGFRHRLYPDYKANRALPDEDLAFQLAACREVAEALGIPSFACDEYEADDYLATLANLAGSWQRVFILSRDKDLAQLLNATTSLWDYGYGEVLTAASFRESRGFEPALVADYLALVGDVSDNIPGVPGIGPKTATAIISRLGPVEHWLDDPDALTGIAVRGSKGLPAKIAGHREQILLAKRLIALEGNIAGLSSQSLSGWPGVDSAGARALFDRLGLGGLAGRLDQLEA